MSEIASIESKSHPKGLYLLFFTEMWERFSFYGMRGILILFLTKTALEGGMGIPRGDASMWYGWFQGFIYITPLLGGFLADRYLGQRTAILIGGVMMMFGQFSLASELGQFSIFLGFILLIFGNGFFKPNISTMVGSLYKQGDPKRDAGFTIFYMGINLGAFLAPLVTGYLVEELFATKEIINGVPVITHYGFRYGFLAAGCGMLLGQIIFNTLGQKYLGEIGKLSAIHKAEDANKEAEKGPLSKEEQDRLVVIFTICFLVIFFWAGFEQAGASLSLYTDKFINRQVGNFLIPTAWFQSVNPLFILVLGPIVNSFFLNMAAKNKSISVPIKMGLGMILLGVGFLFMVGAVLERGGSNAPETVKASLIWLILTYLFHTIGELMLSPIGLSMITRLAPIRFAALMMGVWFFATALGQILGGYAEHFIETMGALEIFASIAAFVMVIGLLLMAISRKMVNMMHGRG